MAERKQSKTTTTTTKKCLRVILQHAPPLRQTELIAMLPNRAEPLSIVRTLFELAALGETLAILWAIFQACVVVIGKRVSLYCRHRLLQMLVSTIKIFFLMFLSQPKLLFV